MYFFKSRRIIEVLTASENGLGMVLCDLQSWVLWRLSGALWGILDPLGVVCGHSWGLSRVRAQGPRSGQVGEAKTLKPAGLPPEDHYAALFYRLLL